MLTQSDEYGEAGLYLSFTHDDALIGLPLYSQGAVIDPGQPGLPFALSNGHKTLYPANPPALLACAGSAVLWPTSSANQWPTFVFLRNRGLVLGLD